MNAPLRLKDSEPSKRSRIILPKNLRSSSRPSPIGRWLHALVALLSSPMGDQGGWEAGARGL